MATFEIPFTPATPQSLSIVLGQTQYRLLLLYRNVDQGGWFVDLSDSQSSAIISGMPLVTGADLLAQYAYLGIGGSLVVLTDHDPDVEPTFENLGDTSHLYFTVATT